MKAIGCLILFTLFIMSTIFCVILLDKLDAIQDTRGIVAAMLIIFKGSLISTYFFMKAFEYGNLRRD